MSWVYGFDPTQADPLDSVGVEATLINRKIVDVGMNLIVSQG